MRAILTYHSIDASGSPISCPPIRSTITWRGWLQGSWDDGPGRRTPDLPLLDWPALARLREQGVTIGAHGMTHRSLPSPALSELEDEVEGCADQIEAHAGLRPTIFAYPYGHRDDASAQIVTRVFPWACTTEFRSISTSSRACALPRLDMGYFEGTRSLDAWGTPWFKARIRFRNGLRQVRCIAVPIKERRW